MSPNNCVHARLKSKRIIYPETNIVPHINQRERAAGARYYKRMNLHRKRQKLTVEKIGNFF